MRIAALVLAVSLPMLAACSSGPHWAQPVIAQDGSFAGPVWQYEAVRLDVGHAALAGGAPRRRNLAGRRLGRLGEPALAADPHKASGVLYQRG